MTKDEIMTYTQHPFIPTIEKLCYNCLRTLPATDYFHVRLTLDKLSEYCKECTLEITRAEQAARCRQGRRYRKVFKLPTAWRGYAGPEAGLAWIMEQGLTLEDLPPLCLTCGKRKKLYPWWNDFTQLHDITWACEPCHRFLTSRKLRHVRHVREEQTSAH